MSKKVVATKPKISKSFKHSKKIMAVIDIGSNASRMIIGGLDDKGVFVRHLFTRVPMPLGLESYSKDNVISSLAQRRLGLALLGLRKIAEAMEVSACVAVATAAIRDCHNRQAVLSSIRRLAGLSVRVLDGTEEAAISGIFVSSQFANKKVLNIDSGGGSTDCAFINKGELVAHATFAIGTARKNCGRASEKKKMQEWLARYCTADTVMACSGGGARKLEELCGLRVLGLQKFLQLARKLTPMERVTKFDLTPDRAHNIIPAAEICLLVLRTTKVQKMQTIKGGLGEALLTNMLHGF